MIRARMPLHHPSLLPGLKRLSARAFFGEVCPRLLKARRTACQAAGGVYLFDVTGENGGRWRLDFGSGTVHQGAHDGTPRLSLRISAESFEAWLAGELD